MTQAQKSLKNKFQNSSLHLNAERQIVDEHEVPVGGGGGGSVVIPSTAELPGAPVAKSMKVDDKNWNLAGGGGGTEVIPSENPVPRSPMLASLTIDGEPWNIPTRKFRESLTRGSGFVWTGKMSHDHYRKMISGGYTIEWAIGSEISDSFTTSDFFTDPDGNHRFVSKGFADKPYTFVGIIKRDVADDEHDVTVVWGSDEVSALTERPEEPVIAKGLRIGDVDWVFENTGGSTVIASSQSAGGARTARSLAIDGVIWNMPSEGGGGGGEAVWGTITGNIDEQIDLKTKFDTLNASVEAVRSTANAAKSRADKAYDKAEDAQDDADYAGEKADGAIAEAAAAAGAVGAVEFQIQTEIQPAIAAVAADVSTKASKSSVSSLESDLSNAKKEISTLQNKVHNLETRMDQLWTFVETEIKKRFVFVELENKEGNE